MTEDKIELIAIESHEQTQDFAARMTKPGNIVPPDEEIPVYMHYYMLAVVMHRLKMVGIVWFDDEVYPTLPGVSADVTLNPDETDPTTTAERTEMYHGMPLTGMVNLSRILAKPGWAN